MHTARIGIYKGNVLIDEIKVQVSSLHGDEEDNKVAEAKFQQWFMNSWEEDDDDGRIEWDWLSD